MGMPMPLAPRSPKPEDALPVGDDDDADVFLAPVVENLRDAPLVVRRDEEALRLARDVRKLPAGLADGRRVDHGRISSMWSITVR